MSSDVVFGSIGWLMVCMVGRKKHKFELELEANKMTIRQVDDEEEMEMAGCCRTMAVGI